MTGVGGLRDQDDRFNPLAVRWRVTLPGDFATAWLPLHSMRPDEYQRTSDRSRIIP